MELTIVVGNPKPKSRTLTIAEAVADRVMAVTGGSLTNVVDLCDHAPDLFTWPDDELAKINDVVAASDVVVFASPTYKASFTGLLKAFLDRYSHDALAGVTAIPVMTGASPAHSLAIDTMLRPVLVELGASMPSRGLYFVMTQMDELGPVVDAWAEPNVPLIAQAVAR